MPLRVSNGPKSCTVTVSWKAPLPETSTSSLICPPGLTCELLACVFTAGLADTTVVSAASPQASCEPRISDVLSIRAR